VSLMPSGCFSVSLAGVSLGLARAAIDALCELAMSEKPMDSKQLLKAKLAVRSAIGRAEAALRDARAFLFEAVQALWDVAETGSPSLSVGNGSWHGTVLNTVMAYRRSLHCTLSTITCEFRRTRVRQCRTGG
jgi:hypothetical protein